MKCAAVIFDFYGTLVDDFAASVGPRHMDFVEPLDVPVEAFRRVWRETTDMRVMGAFQTVEASIEYVCGRLGVPRTGAPLKRAVELRLDLIRQSLDPRPDAVSTLTTLRNHGYKTGLLSNCSIEIPILWPETPFADLFDAATFSSRERLKKPDPRIFQLACDRIGVPPERCLYIADGENYELTAAANLGLRAVLLQNPARDNDSDLLQEAREWRGNTVAALPEVLSFVNV